MRERRRVAGVVGAGLEGEAPHADPHPGQVTADRGAHLGDHAVELVLVDGDDALEQVERVAGGVGDVDQRPRVLGEAAPAPARAGLEELVADALVVAHAQHDVLDVGADRLAHGGDGVDEADLGGEEGVGRVLDRLGRRRVGDDDRRGHPDVERGHPHGGRLVVAADHDAVGVEEVVHRRALAQELGVRHHDHVVAPEHPLDHPGRADRHRRLVDHHGLGRQHGPDLAGRRLDVGQVGRAVVALGRGHAQVGELGGAGGVLGAHDEAEASALHALADQGLEARLDDGDLALAQAGDPVLVDVGAHHVVAEGREARRRGQTHVPRPDHRDLRHLRPPVDRWLRPDNGSGRARSGSQRRW